MFTEFTNHRGERVVVNVGKIETINVFSSSHEFTKDARAMITFGGWEDNYILVKEPIETVINAIKFCGVKI